VYPYSFAVWLSVLFPLYHRELKNALEVIRQETERQAGQHLSLSIAIKRELEGPVIEFVNKQAVHRKNVRFHPSACRS
jgi:hypothetical protein